VDAVIDRQWKNRCRSPWNSSLLPVNFLEKKTNLFGCVGISNLDEPGDANNEIDGRVIGVNNIR
jgi:hypothetical protein